MLLVALAGLAALVWGVADFSGGKATQRADALCVVWLADLLSFPLLAAYVLRSGAVLDPAALGWGFLAGVVGTAGSVVFYRAMACGAMTVVAPVTSVTSAAVPVLVGLAVGERPPGHALGGVGCALVAVAVVSATTPGPGTPVSRRQLVGPAVVAGLGFALFMVFLAAAGHTTTGGLWSLLGAHAVGLLLGGTVLVRHHAARRVWPRRRQLGWVGAAGLLDTAGSATYLVASQHGDLSLVAPVAALYPVTTVLLALVIDHERPGRRQVAGLLLAVAALHLVARPGT